MRFAETRLSALICQNKCAALEFMGYGKGFVAGHGLSPDVFVQMAFQAAYFGLYGGSFFFLDIFFWWRELMSSCEKVGLNVSMNPR